MSSDFLNCSDAVIIEQNKSLPLSYNPLFGMFPSNRVTIYGRSTTVATIKSTRVRNDFKFNFKGDHQQEVYNRKATTSSYNFIPAMIENEYRETVYINPSAQAEMDVDNIKKFSILADKCLMIGDLALPSDVNTEQQVIDFGNRGFLNVDGSLTLSSTLIDSIQSLLNALGSMAAALSSSLEAQPNQIFFIIPYLLKPLWYSILPNASSLGKGLIDEGLSLYGGYTFAEQQVYANPSDANKIIALVSNYVDLNLTVLPQIYKRDVDDYHDETMTRYVSGTLGMHLNQAGAVVLQPYTQS